MYKLFLVYRYLSRRILSVVAMVVLAFAVWILVVAPSVMSGFQEEFHKRLRGTLSDLELSTAKPHTLPDDAEIADYLRGLPNVKAVAPYIENPALDKHLRKNDYCFIRGIEPRNEEKITQLREYFIDEAEIYRQVNDYKLANKEKRAEIDLVADTLPKTVDVDTVWKHLEDGHPEEADLPTIAVGVYYLRRWDLRVGETIRLTTASEEGEVNQDQKFRIVGVFRSGHHDTDRRLVLMSLKNAQKFIKVEGRVSGYRFRLNDYKQADLTKDALRQGIRGAIANPTPLPISGGYYVKTWEERNVNLLRAVRMEKLLIRMMTFMIVAAASASIFLVLFMTVHSKIRELGILRAVGATRSGVLSLFVGQGFIIALIAMAIGLAAGLLTGAYINEIADMIHRTTGWHPFPPEIYYLERIPIKFEPLDTLFNFTVTLALGAVAAIVPGTIAALRPPLKSIRYE